MLRSQRVLSIAALRGQHLRATDDTATPAAAVPENLRKHTKYLLNVYARPSFVVNRGERCYLYEDTGRRYLDFTAGIAVNALGHADAQVAEVAAQQARELVHTSNLYHHPYSGQFAELLVEASNAVRPGCFSKVFFSNSGTEANEAAFKLARKWGKFHGKKSGDQAKKTGIVAFTGAFHGRSMGALSATATEKYRAPFAPLVPNFTFAPFDEVNAIAKHITDDTCAVIVEPMQGEGGINIASEPFLRALRQRCDEVNALLIYDEIQCGMGRTGKLWAHHHYSPECIPDLLTSAKPLANGFPIGALLASERAATVFNIGDHGTTFGGSPFATRLGLHVVERIIEPAFLEAVKRNGDLLRAQLEEVCVAFPEHIAEVRGVGLLIGVEFRAPPTRFIQLCQERNLLLVAAGRQTVRVVPPLIVNEQEIHEAIKIWRDALEALEAEQETQT
ncbi:pyridoxal phosphate-dependent transferase [Syncephalis pseudoplumigaleata]|uniref:acetylornithine transaminase n=1 Tax=Syncephalis pseudoplumigaleata TaxID=1712513 RepID=A0A4P9YRD3_9FUNG|nr:pyridoxal phosphate-dependent transferase [Syncephalis pseudoplumigaleata]|eukprot:RKP22406.1 pyridoxal phosphate-dependent transferase [Syncephalis pseudoplumigaleata]